MPKPRFQVRLIGTDIVPENVKASDLAEFVLQIEKAILATAESLGVSIPEDALVSLVSVEEGSSKLTIALASTVVTAASAVSHAIHSHDYSNIPRPAHEAIAQIGRQAVQRHWSVQIERNTAIGVELGVISEDHPVPPPPSPPQTSGTTTVFGRCVRVGGVQPKAEIRLPSGDLLFIDVSEEMARELARSLYDEVCIEGDATWRTDDWSLQRFAAHRITGYRQTDPVTAFERLATAAARRWDGIDADEFVGNLRSGGEA